MATTFRLETTGVRGDRAVGNRAVPGTDTMPAKEQNPQLGSTASQLCGIPKPPCEKGAIVA